MEYTTHYDAEHQALWGYLAPRSIPTFTPSMLNAMQACDAALNLDAPHCPVDAYIWASATPGYFSLGGDLAHFIDCIERHDRAALTRYATQCVDIIHRRLNHYGSPRLITLALIQGDALGGGLEAALANDVIIAEKQASFGFPEIRFNMFPGMGGYPLMSRRIGARATEAMMTGGSVYSAQACHQMGFVDQVVPTGTGLAAVREFLQNAQPRKNGLAAIYAARQAACPVTYDTLLDTTTQWVDAALRLQGPSLAYMTQLVHKQQSLPLAHP
ncbi:crotonase/enoyl-CoA hydratase family protein [Pseudomonas sp. TE3610]